VTAKSQPKVDDERPPEKVEIRTHKSSKVPADGNLALPSSYVSFNDRTPQHAWQIGYEVDFVETDYIILLLG